MRKRSQELKKGKDFAIETVNIIDLNRVLYCPIFFRKKCSKGSWNNEKWVTPPLSLSKLFNALILSTAWYVFLSILLLFNYVKLAYIQWHSRQNSVAPSKFNYLFLLLLLVPEARQHLLWRTTIKQRITEIPPKLNEGKYKKES